MLPELINHSTLYSFCLTVQWGCDRTKSAIRLLNASRDIFDILCHFSEHEHISVSIFSSRLIKMITKIYSEYFYKVTTSFPISHLITLCHCDGNTQRSQQLVMPFRGVQSLNGSRHSARISRTRGESRMSSLQLDFLIVTLYIIPGWRSA